MARPKAIDQLYKINREANSLLDQAAKDPELKLKAMKEIRGQLKLQMEIITSLYDMQAIQEFQNAVLQIIGEIDSDVREKIIQKLKERNALRSAVKFH